VWWFPLGKEGHACRWMSIARAKMRGHDATAHSPSYALEIQAGWDKSGTFLDFVLNIALCLSCGHLALTATLSLAFLCSGLVLRYAFCASVF
jgi:hypothetical protein